MAKVKAISWLQPLRQTSYALVFYSFLHWLRCIRILRAEVMAEVAGPSCDWCKVFDIAVFDSAESTILIFLCLFLNMHFRQPIVRPC